MRAISSRSAGRRGLLAAALALVAIGAAPVAPAAARGHSCRSATADRSLPYWNRQRAATVVVDSVLLSGKPKLQQVMSCRRLAFRGRPALMIGIAARELRAAGRRVAPLAIVGVGYNSLWEHDRRNYDTWAARFDREANRLVDTLRALGARQVVWVTLREPKPQFLTATGRGELHLYSWYFPYANERLHVLDRRRDDVVLADWAAVSDRPGLTYDSIHLTAKGGVLLARTVRRAINAEARRQALLRTAAAAQVPPAPAPPAPPAPAPPPALVLTAPALRAEGIAIPLAGRGAIPGAAVELQRFVGGARWVTLKSATAAADGTVHLRYAPTQLSPTHRYRLRVASGGVVSPALTVRTRTITLAAFGDANFGDGVGSVMDQRGALYPWQGVAPTLRSADIAFGNLECAISNRGFAVPKEFQFRGRPERLAQVIRFAGLDVLNLANNHAGDYGPQALLDTVRNVRADGALPVGAGATLAAARRPQVVSRLGLRVGFVGFSDIGPTSFAAGPNRPGTSFASLPAIAAGVRAARRVSDVVVVTFHWGIERSTSENDRQRMFARAALAAGATAVIAAHPHVLQPIRRVGPGRRGLVAYSLGNFVWSSSAALTSRTGVLRVQLSGRGVEAARLLPAIIEGTRPRLLGPR